MKRCLAVPMLMGFALLATAPKLEAQSNAKEEDRLYNSALVVKEAMGMKSRIPQKVLDNAKCVIVIPSVIKGAVGFGGSYGRGAMSCRGGEDFNGPWTYPTMMALEGGSAGLQIGAQATDFVLMVMDERGASAILSGKFKIGGDAAASAGPIGRDSQANLDIYMRTTILSYSRSRGLFAGVSLEGSTLRPDNRANEKLYGKKLNARNIVLENAVPTPPPAPAEKLVATLDKYGKSAAGTSAAAVAAPTAPAAPASSPAPTPRAPPPNHPPAVTCAADPAEVVSGSGNTVLVRADASDPDNDPLTYTWTTTAGTIDGSGSKVHWNPAGVAPGAYAVTAHVDDGQGGTADCRAELRVEAPADVESKLAKQEDIQKMEQQTLLQLYEAQPLAKAAIERAAGYAVFSDMGFKILFAGSGTGQGVVVNNQTKQKTYMKMVELQAGLGFGISKFRNIFVFITKAAMESFTNSGWQFGGQATAGAKTADSGGAMQGAVTVDNDIWMYQLTEEGLNLSVTVTGAKYYKDDSLN